MRKQQRRLVERKIIELAAKVMAEGSEGQTLKKRRTKNENLWEIAICCAMANFSDSLFAMYKMHYVKKLKENEVCEKLHIEHSTYHRWRREIVDEVLLQAAVLHVIEV